MIDTYEIDNVVDKNQTTYRDTLQYITSEDSHEFTDTGDVSSLDALTTPLPFDLDIFDIVKDERVSSKPRATIFLSRLRKVIQDRKNSFENIHFNRLSIEESEKPEELMVDWLYNYFRVFYSFDDKQGDMYGLILNNTVSLEFSSEFKPLKVSEYDKVAEKTVDFVVENIRR